MNRKGPWEGYSLLPAFLCAHIFIKTETSGYEADQEVRLRSDSRVWSEFALGLLVIAFFAVTDFFRSNVGLTFSFLLVLRLLLHAVYYAKNETSKQ